MRWFTSLFSDADELGRRYAEGKATLPLAAAEKTVQEACETAAKAELARAQMRVANQEDAGKFIQNLEAISKLPDQQQSLAFAKLMACNPEVLAQWKRLKDVLLRLQRERGTKINLLPFDLNGWLILPLDEDDTG